MERRKLIVVSNRGPVSYTREGTERIAKRGGGGLVTALRGLVSHHDVTWIASAITEEDRVVGRETIEETARDGSPFRLRVVDHGLLHAWEHGYVRVNQGFADAVLEELEAEPDAAVLFHDYHLYLAPRFVRDRAPDAMLSHFVHIPWPQPDYWRILPAEQRHAIHDGLLANDVVGFHSE